MSIYRIAKGVIFDDSFETLDQRWLVSPSNSYSYEQEDARLTLKHNTTSERSVNALFEIPKDEEQLLLQVHAEYDPTELGDDGGIVIWKNAMEKVEFLESVDTKQEGAYSVWRATKRGNLWSFFAEKGGTWELFDSTICISPSMAGVVLRGRQEEGFKDLNLDRVVLCKGSAITLGNVEYGYTVELLDGDTEEVVTTHVIPNGFSGIDIELPTIPFNGRLRVTDTNETEGYTLIDEMEEPVLMYGGDVFLKGTDLKVIWKGVVLDDYEPTHIGSLKNDSNEQKMTLWNPSTGNIAEDIYIRIGVYYEDIGWTWADISNDDNGRPVEYQDTTIYMGRLDAGEKRDFWIKVTKDEEYKQWDRSLMRPLHFMLDITNE